MDNHYFSLHIITFKFSLFISLLLFLYFHLSSEKRNETVPLSSARLPPPFSLDSFPQNFNINDITGQSQSMRNVEVSFL